MSPPYLSIICPSKTHENPQLQRLLRSLKHQTFQDFEVLIETEGNSEEAKAIAAQKAQGTLLGFFCSDNDFRDPDFLQTMVWYASRPDAIGAYTSQFDYVPTDYPLSRYFALLGANDPLCWYLGKADRSSYLSNHAQTQRRIFNADRATILPSLGDNGFFIKRSVFLQQTFTPATFGSCMCSCERLRQLGHASYWIVAEQKLWHRTGEDILDYFKRRWRYVRSLYWQKQSIRQWQMVGTSADYWRTLSFVAYSLSVVGPLWTAGRGYRRLPDWAWFLHLVVCPILTLMYGVLCLEHCVRRLLSQPTTAQRS